MELILKDLSKEEKKIITGLKSIGIERPSDLILYMPRSYIDTSTPSLISNVEIGGSPSFFRLKILSKPSSRLLKNGTKLITFSSSDGFSSAQVSCFASSPKKSTGGFNDQYTLEGMITSLNAGDYINLFGTVDIYNGNKQINLRRIVPDDQTNMIIPQYKGAVRLVSEKGNSEKKKRLEIKSEKIQQRIKMAFSNQDVVKECLLRIIYALKSNQKYILEVTNSKFSSIYECLYKIHFPSSIDEANEAKSDLIKIGTYQIYKNSRDRTTITDDSCIFNIDVSIINDLFSRIEFPPTNDQLKATIEIVKDLNKNKPMRRILSGDVGVGKTLPYLISAVAAQMKGRNVGIMIPNVLVALQVATELKKYFPEIPFILLQKGDAKKKGFSIGENNPILIGTSSLIFALKDSDYKIEYLIVDEQHRMGVQQREILKNSTTHSLEATATAIPRTMAIVCNGGLDVSVIKEKPVVKKIKTMIMEEKDKIELMKKIKSIVDMGRQVAIIYPIVEKKEQDQNQEDDATLIEPDDQYEEPEDEKVREVVIAGEQMEKYFPNKVCVLHGKMKPEEKEKKIQEMKDNKYNVLIASTVIEIGVTVPSMMAVIVVDADRYGVTTLHQLRGRIDRKGEITAMGEFGLFIMMIRRKMNQKIRDRLSILVNHDDGFKIAEEDMIQRGFGDLSKLGSKQSGESSSIFYNLKIPHETLPSMFEYFESIENK